MIHPLVRRIPGLSTASGAHIKLPPSSLSSLANNECLATGQITATVPTRSSATRHASTPTSQT
jgi:hypothetical protein